MDQRKEERERPQEGSVTSTQNEIVPSPLPPTPTETDDDDTFTFSTYLRNQQYSHSPQHIHHLQQELEENLNKFWTKQYQEIEGNTELKGQSVPLARIKKIMKANEDVRMISAEATLVFAKACEMFIKELAVRSRVTAAVNKRRTIQRSDIESVISSSAMFDFLAENVPKEDTMEHEAFMNIPRRDTVPIQFENVPYYYAPVPPQDAAGPSHAPFPRMLMGGRPPLSKLPVVPHPQVVEMEIPKDIRHSSESTDSEND